MNLPQRYAPELTIEDLVLECDVRKLAAVRGGTAQNTWGSDEDSYLSLLRGTGDKMLMRIVVWKYL